MDEMDAWRLTDCYSVVDAAALITGIPPSNILENAIGEFHLGREAIDEDLNCDHDTCQGREPVRQVSDLQAKVSNAFDSVLKALFYAIQNEKLKVTRRYDPAVLGPKELSVGHQPRMRVSLPAYLFDGALNLKSSTIDRDDLVSWLSGRGVRRHRKITWTFYVGASLEAGPGRIEFPGLCQQLKG